jgi:holo-[acyl-carrier protein] synthase
VAGPVGVGIDLVEVECLAQALERTPTLEARLFTPGELADVTSGGVRAERLAARFAAKEAALKALGLGLGGAGWHDVEVRTGPGGRPELSVTGRAADRAAEQGVDGWLVSLTHTAALAEAVVIALG